MKTKKNAAPFASMSDEIGTAIVKEDLKAISDLRGFEGKNKNGHFRHNASIYAGTENMTAFVGDGRIIEENKAKKAIVPPATNKKNSFNVIAFCMDHVKELAKKFPEEEFAWSLLPGIVQMTTKKVQIKKEVSLSFRPKARTFKDQGVKGDVAAVEKIDGQFYSFAPEYQEMGLKIHLKRK